jgi:hypothetical protein
VYAVIVLVPQGPGSGPASRTSMTRREWMSLGGMAAFILALHVIGWFTLVAAPETAWCRSSR